MAMNDTYAVTEPVRSAVDSLDGPTVLEFGTPWCGHCRATQPLLALAFADYPEVPHFKIEDGKGRALGRSFRVALWPTLIFLSDGKEVVRLVRPSDWGAIRDALAQIARTSQSTVNLD